MGILEVKKGRRESLRRLLVERTRKSLSASDTNFNLESPGSPRINEKERRMENRKAYEPATERTRGTPGYALWNPGDNRNNI
ncbi:hypothetical protein TNCV_2469241 [Trichonephila clavipes]|nr:hypothetical protein TNCV_2469241 [Trichonephila clavipes]